MVLNTMPGQDISSIADGLFYGSFIAVFLSGITLTMAWLYCEKNEDGWPLRLFVSTSLVIGMASTCCKVFLVHHYLVGHFGDINELTKAYPLFVAVIFCMSGVIFLLVHVFFAWRLLSLSKSKIIPAFIALLTVTMLAFNAYSVAKPTGPMSEIALIVFHGLAMFTDVLVTVSFSAVLQKSKESAFSSGTMAVIRRLLLFITTRGILLTAIQAAHVAMLLKWRQHLLLWASLHFILDEVNLITMMVMLNSRERLRDRMGTVVDVDAIYFADSASARRDTV